MPIKIVIGSDHAGLTLKEALKSHLQTLGYGLEDVGTYTADSMDYPDPAHAVARIVAAGSARFGILICGSGNGVSITANRHHGIRCALAWNREIAMLARAHNDANVLALPARFMVLDEATASVDAFISGEFEGGRHIKRVEKIEAC